MDELQWCDVPSLRFRVCLARRVEGVGVLLVATLPTGEPGLEDEALVELS
jgi:hypothetical protein